MWVTVEWLCCVFENNISLYINDTSIKNIFKKGHIKPEFLQWAIGSSITAANLREFDLQIPKAAK